MSEIRIGGVSAGVEITARVVPDARHIIDDIAFMLSVLAANNEPRPVGIRLNDEAMAVVVKQPFVIGNGNRSFLFGFPLLHSAQEQFYSFEYHD